jgi:hypothetical protein
MTTFYTQQLARLPAVAAFGTIPGPPKTPPFAPGTGIPLATPVTITS